MVPAAQCNSEICSQGQWFKYHHCLYSFRNYPKIINSIIRVAILNNGNKRVHTTDAHRFVSQHSSEVIEMVAKVANSLCHWDGRRRYGCNTINAHVQWSRVNEYSQQRAFKHLQ